MMGKFPLLKKWNPASRSMVRTNLKSEKEEILSSVLLIVTAASDLNIKFNLSTELA